MRRRGADSPGGPTGLSADAAPVAWPAARSAYAREAVLAAVWEHQWLDGRPLVDSQGRTLQVVYPGRRWGGPGPDFQGALIALADGSLLRGDVEIHLRAADWRAHGHHRDTAYNRTLLQVVLRAEPGVQCQRQDGQPVPSLGLADWLVEPLEVLAIRLAAGPQPGPHDLACLESAETLARIVDQAGLTRFFEKAAAFEAELTVRPAGEVLYRGMLVGMGYSANKEACGLLSELVPWELARRVARGPRAEERVRALLLGAAGLLPAQRGLRSAGGEPAGLEADWRELAPELGRRPLSPAAWRLGGVRPENSPARRLVGAAVLVVDWAGGDSPDEQLAAVLEHRDAPSRLKSMFRARSPVPFWTYHYDFGVPTASPRPWVVGTPRAGEILVNVLLPLGYALGRAGGDSELSASCLLAYHRLPAGAWNRISRTMAAQLFGSAGLRLCASAARQQGLLHLFKRWCWERRCDNCPAGERRRAAPSPSTSRLGELRRG